MAAAVQRSLVSRDVAQFAALPSKAKPLSRVHTRAARIPAVKCTYDTESSRKEETVSFREFGRSLLAATAVMCGAADLLFMPPEAMADLNKFEANVRGEFGIGSAAQYGAADLRYEDRLSFHPPLFWTQSCIYHVTCSSTSLTFVFFHLSHPVHRAGQPFTRTKTSGSVNLPQHGIIIPSSLPFIMLFYVSPPHSWCTS